MPPARFCFPAAKNRGVIIVRADSRAQVEAVIAEDPFYQAKLAEYQITQFIPTKTAADLDAYRETL